MELPFELKAGLDEEMSKYPAKKLSRSVSELSQRYRSGKPMDNGRFLKSGEDIAAYAAFRMPATFAAVYAALEQVKGRMPDWSPKTLLDIGAGPGTVMWASSLFWPEIEKITLVEREEGMISLGKRLSSYSQMPSLNDAEWIRADVTGKWDVPKNDLVVLSYVLGELSIDVGRELIEKLWNLTGGVLMIIEPGTPAGFARIKDVRDILLSDGANVIAPCPHDGLCPIKGDNWCHFSQRVSRSKIHRQVKDGELSYEDEKFSFLAVSRITPGTEISGRVLRHPQVGKGHIGLEICTMDGLKSIVVTRKNKDAFREARGLCWGSALTRKDGEDKESI